MAVEAELPAGTDDQHGAGLGGAQRVFHDHSVELAKHYAITEAVFIRRR